MDKALRNLLAAILGFFVLIVAPAGVQACSGCVMAITDYHLPPIMAWMALLGLWYLIQSIVVWHGEKSGGLLMILVKNFLGFIVIFFLYLSFLGPLVLFPLLLPIGQTLYRTWLRPPPWWEASLQVRLKVVGVLGLTALVTLSLYSYRMRGARDPFTYLKQWGFSSLTIGLVTEEIEMMGKAALPQLRPLVVSCGSDVNAIEFAAKLLAQKGEPETDVPVLLKGLAQCRGQQDARGVAAINGALVTLTGIDPGEELDAADWRKFWEEKRTEAAAHKP